MPIFDKILIPIDFSEVTETGLKSAVILADKFRSSEIHLVNVTEISMMSYLDETSWMGGYYLTPEQRDKNMQKLHSMVNKIHIAHPVQISYTVTEGSLIPTLERYVLQNLIDVIVIGTYEIGGIIEILTPSNADKIASSISCPILSVHPDSPMNDFHKLIIPVSDFYPVNKLKYAINIATYFKSEIHVVCLQSELTNNPKTAKALASVIDELNLHQIRYVTHIALGKNLTNELLEYAEKKSSNVILVNPGVESKLQKSFIPAIGGHIINHSRIPVLTIEKNIVQ